MKPLRLILQGLVRGYQLMLSPFMPPCCRFAPSCSHYAIEALGRHGVVKGAWLAFVRIARCHPWGGDGYDPVPDRFSILPARGATGLVSGPGRTKLSQGPEASANPGLPWSC